MSAHERGFEVGQHPELLAKLLVGCSDSSGIVTLDDCSDRRWIPHSLDPGSPDAFGHEVICDRLKSATLVALP